MSDNGSIVVPSVDRVTSVTPRINPDSPPGTTLQRVQDDSFLILSSYNSLAGITLGIRARVLNDDGSIAYIDEAHTPNADRTIKTTYHQLKAGTLLDVAVLPTAGTPRRGQTYAVVCLADRVQPIPQRIQPIAKGYVHAGAALIWPHGAWCDSVEGPGWMRSAAGTTPGAGADFLITVPTGARWALRSLTAQLVTAVAAATRVATLIIDDGSTTLFSMPYATGQIASLTRQYFWENLSYAVGLVGAAIYVPVPLPFPLLAGWRISSSTALIQAADQWSAIQYDVEEWIEG